jgi:hypothetical protein
MRATFLKNWAALVFVAALVVFAVNAHIANDATEQASVRRTVSTCQRQNPRNAYLWLRATEFVSTDKHERSFTTQVAPQVFALMNCEATVAQNRPVTLDDKTTKKYIEIYQQRLVPTVKNGRIVGTTPFSVYFNQRP